MRISGAGNSSCMDCITVIIALHPTQVLEYAPIRQDYEDFYTRRMYYRIHVRLGRPHISLMQSVQGQIGKLSLTALPLPQTFN